jgi:uncharacterized membrane protein (UPF0136 family)
LNWATRTLIPIIAGTILAWAANLGLNIDSGAVLLIVTAVVIYVYASAARFIEKRWPALGKILMSLGLSSEQPVYLEPPITTKSSVQPPSPDYPR